MKRIYLRILDIDQFDTAKISDEQGATHCIEIEDEDYDSALNFIWKYLDKIRPYLPLDPGTMSSRQAQG
ncbi:MAG: hypothetical protein V3U24_05370 [Candidatus Neomarinimicrobiota bacterium]